MGNIEGNGKAASLGLDGQEDGVYEKSQGKLKKIGTITRAAARFTTGCLRPDEV